MPEKKKTFLLFLEQKENFPDYSDEELGQIFRAVYEYADTGTMQEFQDRGMKVLFRSICRQIDLSNEKYEEMRQARSEQGQKGGAPKGNRNASKNNLKQPETTENNLKQPETTENNLKQPNNQNNQNKLTNTNTLTNTGTGTDTQSVNVTGTITDTGIITVSQSVSEQTDGLTKSQTMFFDVLLFKLGSELAYDSPKSEQELSALDIIDRDVQKCTIPYEILQYDQRTMQDALKFLTGFSNLSEGEFKNFADTVIQCLSEAICTGKLSQSESVFPNELIDRLNLINQTVSIGQWLETFSLKYSKTLVTQGNNIHNRYGYLKKCAVNYLIEYQASEIIPGFKSNSRK